MNPIIARKVSATYLQRNIGTDLTVDQQTIVVTSHGRPQFAMMRRLARREGDDE